MEKWKNHIFGSHFAMDASISTCISSKWSGQDSLSHGRSYAQVRTSYYVCHQKTSWKRVVFRTIFEKTTNFPLVWLGHAKLGMKTLLGNMTNYQAFQQANFQFSAWSRFWSGCLRVTPPPIISRILKISSFQIFQLHGRVIHVNICFLGWRIHFQSHFGHLKSSGVSFS